MLLISSELRLSDVGEIPYENPVDSQIDAVCSTQHYSATLNEVFRVFPQL
jgi:hypothetical protein